MTRERERVSEAKINEACIEFQEERLDAICDQWERLRIGRLLEDATGQEEGGGKVYLGGPAFTFTFNSETLVLTEITVQQAAGNFIKPKLISDPFSPFWIVARQDDLFSCGNKSRTGVLAESFIRLGVCDLKEVDCHLRRRKIGVEGDNEGRTLLELELCDQEGLIVTHHQKGFLEFPQEELESFDTQELYAQFRSREWRKE